MEFVFQYALHALPRDTKERQLPLRPVGWADAVYDVRPHRCNRKQMQLDHVVNHHASTLLVVDTCAIQLELRELDSPVPSLGDWGKASACILQPLLHLTWSFMLRWGHVMHSVATLTVDLPKIERNLRENEVKFSQTKYSHMCKLVSLLWLSQNMSGRRTAAGGEADAFMPLGSCADHVPQQGICPSEQLPPLQCHIVACACCVPDAILLSCHCTTRCLLWRSAVTECR